jgi:hypothetical protein
MRVADAAEALVIDHEQILLQLADMHRHHDRWQRNLAFGRVSFLLDAFCRALDKLQHATVFQLRHPSGAMHSTKTQAGKERGPTQQGMIVQARSNIPVCVSAYVLDSYSYICMHSTC